MHVCQVEHGAWLNSWIAHGLPVLQRTGIRVDDRPAERTHPSQIESSTSNDPALRPTRMAGEGN